TGTDHANAQVDPPYCIPPADHTPSKPSNVGRVQRLRATDYPHSECQFPDSVSNILAWSSLTADRQRKLLWVNANRFFRPT
ncbi:MAG TPA: hypothetical protein VKI44_12910, partial [Acetobacteraceae bacterium]|nr:hypothetical protein [Acetobacteraceae bacterium]